MQDDGSGDATGKVMDVRHASRGRERDQMAIPKDCFNVLRYIYFDIIERLTATLLELVSVVRAQIEKDKSSHAGPGCARARIQRSLSSCRSC